MTFEEIIRRDKLVLIDFFATWCGPCRAMTPILEQVKKKIGNTATLVKIDVDKNQGIAARYQVQGVPTLILFKNAQPVWRQSGVVQANQLEKIINDHQ